MITFLHLHKCGGTYVHNSLKANLHNARFAPRDGSGRVLLPAPCDADVIVSGHLSARDIKHKLPGKRPIAVILREPLERLLSHYYFLTSYYPSALSQYNSKTAGKINKASLTEIASSRRMLASFKDDYLRMLDPEWRPESPENPSLDRAIAFLGECHAIGITSRMKEFLARIEAITGEALGGEAPSIFGNRREELRGMQGFRQAQREEISQDTIKLLNRATRKDRMIYNFALSRCI